METCSICNESLNTYFRHKNLVKLPCLHIYHLKCFNTWYDKCEETDYQFPSCPLCRLPIKRYSLNIIERMILVITDIITCLFKLFFK